MYDELVKALRGFEDYDGLDFLENRTYAQDIAREAADAIEKLQKAVLRLEEASGILDELPMVDQREPPKEE